MRSKTNASPLRRALDGILALAAIPRMFALAALAAIAVFAVVGTDDAMASSVIATFVILALLNVESAFRSFHARADLSRRAPQIAYAGFATKSLQEPSALIGPLTTLQPPHASG